MSQSPPHRPVTYILPTTAWALLLDAIARDAPPGSRIRVATEAMCDLTRHTLAAAARHDVTVWFSPELAYGLDADQAA